MPRRAIPRPCACGCEEMTKGGKFIPGHDSRLYSAILQHIDGDVADLAEIVEFHTGSPIEAGHNGKTARDASTIRTAVTN